jgi:hypothetical protein
MASRRDDESADLREPNLWSRQDLHREALLALTDFEAWRPSRLATVRYRDAVILSELAFHKR